MSVCGIVRERVSRVPLCVWQWDDSRFPTNVIHISHRYDSDCLLLQYFSRTALNSSTPSAIRRVICLPKRNAKRLLWSLGGGALHAEKFICMKSKLFVIKFEVAAATSLAHNSHTRRPLDPNPIQMHLRDTHEVRQSSDKCLWCVSWRQNKKKRLGCATNFWWHFASEGASRVLIYSNLMGCNRLQCKWVPSFNE